MSRAIKEIVLPARTQGSGCDGARMQRKWSQSQSKWAVGWRGGEKPGISKEQTSQRRGQSQGGNVPQPWWMDGRDREAQSAEMVTERQTEEEAPQEGQAVVTDVHHTKRRS